MANATADTLLFFATLIGSLATAVSVLFGFYSYNQGRLKEQFSKLRSDLIELDSGLKDADDLLSLPLIMSISQEFCQQISHLLGSDQSQVALRALFSNKERHAPLTKAHIYSVNKSAGVKEINEGLSRARKVIASHSNTLPITFYIQSKCVDFLAVVMSFPLAMERFTEFVESETRLNVVLDAIDKNQFAPALLSVEHLLTDYTYQLTLNHQRFVDSARNIINDLSQRILTCDDRRLHKLSKLEQRKTTREDTSDNMSVKQLIEQIKARLQLIRSSFSPPQWDSVWQNVAKLEAQFDGSPST